MRPALAGSGWGGGCFFVLLKWLEQADCFDAPLVEHLGDEVGEDLLLFS